jgi:hypothetical protein
MGSKERNVNESNERVRLATEVLARLEAGKLRPSEWGYWEQPTDAAPCGVCACAALAVACCGLDELSKKNAGYGKSLAVIACLAGVFGVAQLAHIEAAYERGPNSIWEDSGLDEATLWETVAATAAWHGLSKSARLRAIMQNIVANGGEFVP